MDEEKLDELRSVVTGQFAGSPMLVSEAEMDLRTILAAKEYQAGQVGNRYFWFTKALDNIIETHHSKNVDYARTTDPFNNFIESAKSAGIKVWQSFENLIGTKEARIRSLRLEEKEPNNESILDTYKDRAVYAILAYAYELREQEKPPFKSEG